MKVREMIEALEGLDQNAEVFVAHPSHDYWHRTLASKVHDVEELNIRYSDYHQQTIVDDEGEGDDFHIVITLR